MILKNAHVGCLNVGFKAYMRSDASSSFSWLHHPRLVSRCKSTGKPAARLLQHSVIRHKFFLSTKGQSSAAMGSTSLVAYVAGVSAIILCAQAAAASGSTVFEATKRYNSLPWHFTIDKLFAFAVSPLKTAPTNPLTYPGYPQWPFYGGTGWLVAIKFSDSPIASYSELFYIPGLYKPDCSAKPYFSVQRIWVDSEHSRHAGRSIWGIPKEMAAFDWQSGQGKDAKDTWTAVSVTDNATGNVFFQANMTDLVEGPGVPMPSWLIPSNIRTVVQWPIDDAKHTFLGSKQAYASTKISKFTTAKKVTDTRPILTELGFEGSNPAVAKALTIEMDGKTFTGRENEQVTAIPLAVHLKPGSQATLSAPRAINTC